MTLTILYVEDNPSNVTVVERVVDSLGYRLLLAADGQSGLDVARTELPNLILMDVGLPDMTGLEVTTILRGEEATRDIPIVAITAHAMNGDRERCLEAGCNEYLAKPFQVRELTGMIRMFVKPFVEDLS
jgi:two-component system cell cycle response regulator DivK